MLALALLAIGIIARFMTHEPNFTPTIALVLFGGVYLDRKYAVLLPLALMMITDAFLGMHSAVAFTWGGFILVACIGLGVRKRKNAVTILGSSLLSAIVFFIVSNLGVWIMGWYSHTFQGFVNCYVAAIPFFRTTLISTIVYSCAFFGIYEIVALRVKDTRLARVLLTS